MAVPSRMFSQGAQSTMAALQSTIPPAFLLPSFFRTQASSFSTSSPALARQDMNRRRGLSALRSTGLRRRQVLSVKLKDLPQPASDISAVQVDPEHGLWQFFNRDRLPFATPEYDDQHGRAWTVEELRAKDWEDLHRLWWVCLKEKNRLSTEAVERERVKAGYGQYESEDRLKEVKLTQRAIKHVLVERWYAWEDARKIAANDPSVNLSAGPDEVAYNPKKDPELIAEREAKEEKAREHRARNKAAREAAAKEAAAREAALMSGKETAEGSPEVRA